MNQNSNTESARADCSPATLLGHWVNISDKMPPHDVVVETKIDDGRGVRNVAKLRMYRNLWWFPDMSMYVYYSPTHWREVA